MPADLNVVVKLDMRNKMVNVSTLTNVLAPIPVIPTRNVPTPAGRTHVHAALDLPAMATHVPILTNVTLTMATVQQTPFAATLTVAADVPASMVTK